MESTAAAAEASVGEKNTEQANNLSNMAARKKLGEGKQLRIGSSMSDKLCSSPASCISC